MAPRTALTFALAIFLCPAGVLAQTSQPASDVTAPAHVSLVEGSVVLEREGRAENSPLNMPLLSGDRLKTLDGRVEVLFADGSALHLDSRTTLDIQSDELARLIDGRIRLAMVGRGLTYRVDSPAGSVRIAQPGEFKLSMLHGDNETQLELAVIRGAAEIFTDQGSTSVRAGERAYASAGLAPSYAYSYNSANFDAFDQWAEARRDTRLGASAQYLPEDVRPYATTFDQYGDWRYVQTYGYVWYPRVAATWRPYYYGRWASYPRYGWTWIGVDAFSWPTHHYGRWGFSAGSWFWIPSAHWAPAYVSWAYAPGYVSWCPLGWNNQAVFGFSVPGFSVGFSWTSVSYAHFGYNYYVHQRAVHWDHAHPAPHFVVRPVAPAYRSAGYYGRTATPIRWAGGRDVAVPRSSTSVYGNRSVVVVPRSTAPAYVSRDVAVPRGSTAASPDRAASATMTRSIAPQTAGTSREFAVPRTGTAPRYVNRGDEIIRSQTARPLGPAPSVAPQTRTVPVGPLRRADDAPAFDRVAPRADRQPNAYAVPRADAAAPGVGVQSVHPDFQPRTVMPRAAAPMDRPGGDAAIHPDYRPRFEAPAARAPEFARPRGESAAPAPAPARGGGRVEGRQPPPSQAAPSGGGERAVPRRGGGRGGV